MSTDKGYIKIYRDIREHWIWDDEPYDKARAWIDLIMVANHKDKTILFDGHPMKIKRGQYMTSLQSLADRWGWSRGKARRFLDVLKSEQMIDKKLHSNGTLITIVNYSNYQDSRNAKQHTCDTPAAVSRTPDGHKQDIKEVIKKHEEERKPPSRVNDDDHNPWDDEITPEEEEVWLNS